MPTRTAAAPPRPEPAIRLWGPHDDPARLTELIHAAYRHHLQAGLRFRGTHQQVDETVRRLGAGTAWVACSDGHYVATAVLRPPMPRVKVPLYRESGVYSLSQFCVHPGPMGQGLGRRLHDHVVAHARGLGATAIALDTAQPAERLIRLYQAWGYQLAGQCDWRPDTNYLSVLMLLPLGGPAAP